MLGSEGRFTGTASGRVEDDGIGCSTVTGTYCSLNYTAGNGTSALRRGAPLRADGPGASMVGSAGRLTGTASASVKDDGLGCSTVTAL